MKRFIQLSLASLLITLSNGSGAATDADVAHCLKINRFAELIVKHHAKGVSKSTMYRVVYDLGARGGLTTTNMYSVINLVIDSGFTAQGIFDACLETNTQAGSRGSTPDATKPSKEA